MSNFDVFYIEKSLICDVQVVSLIEKYKPKHVITCDHYKEIFNRKSQNFRLQKRKPALILASKKGELVFPVPPKFGIGSQYNYYFSHVLNCIFDCRYCYLQGMYESAHYVLFLNFEDFILGGEEVLFIFLFASSFCFFSSFLVSTNLLR